MDEKLVFAVNELKKAIAYPIEYRIAKYLIESGYSSIHGNGINGKESINVTISKVDPSMSIMYTIRIFNCMRNIELTETKTNPYHITNVPSL